MLCKVLDVALGAMGGTRSSINNAGKILFSPLSFYLIIFWPHMSKQSIAFHRPRFDHLSVHRRPHHRPATGPTSISAVIAGSQEHYQRDANRGSRKAFPTKSSWMGDCPGGGIVKDSYLEEDYPGLTRGTAVWRTAPPTKRYISLRY